ncbi:MAG: hypothetical protein V4671_21545, partial [Armatimonadota bacterium]
MRGTRISSDTDEPVRKIGLMVPEKMIDEIDDAAGSVGLDRASFLRNVVRRYIDGSLMDTTVLFAIPTQEGGRALDAKAN